jgi:hypothetical protein
MRPSGGTFRPATLRLTYGSVDTPQKAWGLPRAGSPSPCVIFILVEPSGKIERLSRCAFAVRIHPDRVTRTGRLSRFFLAKIG